MIPTPARVCGLGLGLFLLFATATQASSFSSVEERMSAAQFKAAGLDKLSPEELAALNAWLQNNTATAPAAGAATGYAPPPDDRIGFRQEAVTGVVVSRIVGPFTGWDGKTKFTLENGQVWEQAEQGGLRGVNLDSPMVTIEPGMFGSWRIKVEGLNATTRVKRVK